jgi:FMN-dependent NADH-azoreductase
MINLYINRKEGNMNTTLVIYSSPMMGSKVGSISELIAQKFIDEYLIHNNDEVIHMDLNEEQMASKTLTSKGFAMFFNEKDSFYYIDQLKNVDKVIVVAPMINFNYPTVLKNYLDHILMAGKTFKYKYNANGQSVGLLSNLKVQIITTQGADYG